MFVLGALKRSLNAQNAKPVELEMNDKLFEARMVKLLPFLQTLSVSNTVENLVRKSAMTQAVVVDTLFLMQKKQLVEEELDMKTGDWYYCLARQIDDQQNNERPLALEERVRRRQEDLLK